MSSADDVLAFWFGEPAVGPEELRRKMVRWYQGGDEMDQAIASRFTADTEAALAGERDGWAADPHGRVALVVVLDQFPRSLWRNTPRAYDGDAAAVRLSVEAFDQRLERGLSTEERHFLLMPFLHAEDLAMQDRAVALMARHVTDSDPELRSVYAMGIEQTHKYRDIIARFGRFPHRNAILGRRSSQEEREFLETWSERQPPAAMRRT